MQTRKMLTETVPRHEVVYALNLLVHQIQTNCVEREYEKHNIGTNYTDSHGAAMQLLCITAVCANQLMSDDNVYMYANSRQAARRG